MNCSFCNTQDTKVIDSRLLQDGHEVRRRRECNKCGNRFTTYEKRKCVMPAVRKSNGHKEPFSRDKILKGIKKATKKIDVGPEEIDNLVDNIEGTILGLYAKEVSTEEIGKIVMKELEHCDPVAYVRFASVYLDYKEIEDFVIELQESVKNKNLR